jgi:hypothetical protein
MSVPAAITVNKLDKASNAESEFEIETLDDTSSMTGGAATPSSNTPNLSVPLNNNSVKVDSLEKTSNTDPSTSEKMPSAPVSSVKQSSIQESAKTNNQMTSSKPDEEDESEFPPEDTEGNTFKRNTSTSIPDEDKELANNLESMQQKPNSTQEVNTAQKTKKKVKKGKNAKKVGATKKKIVAQQPATPTNNNVQPHVEFGNERGTMTIKYASAKTTVPLYSTAKTSHLDLAGLKVAFETEYDTVKGMSADQLTELRHEMQNTEFTEIGSEALIHGLLSLIDDHDTKKLTLKMMLARGLLKVNA